MAIYRQSMINISTAGGRGGEALCRYSVRFTTVVTGTIQEQKRLLKERGFPTRLVTSDYVLDETLTLLGAKTGHKDENFKQYGFTVKPSG